MSDRQMHPDDTAENLLHAVAGLGLAANLTELRWLLPRQLARIAGNVIDFVREEHWLAMMKGQYAGARSGIWGTAANHTGAPSIGLDVRARELIIKSIEAIPFAPRPLVLGEECPLELRSALKDGQLILVIDALDGSTRANTLGEGFACVIVAFVQKGGRPRLIGGAIATSVSDTRFSFDHRGAWNAKRKGDQFQDVDVVNDIAHEKLTMAMVTGGSVKKTRYLANVAERVAEILEQPILVEANGGNPKLFPLVGLKLDLLLEPLPTKVYDAALLLPLVATTGVEVRNLERRRAMTLEEVIGAFEKFIESGGDNQRRDMPPYLVRVAPRPVGEAALRAIREIPYE